MYIEYFLIAHRPIIDHVNLHTFDVDVHVLWDTSVRIDTRSRFSATTLRRPARSQVFEFDGGVLIAMTELTMRVFVQGLRQITLIL